MFYASIVDIVLALKVMYDLYEIRYVNSHHHKEGIRDNYESGRYLFCARTNVMFRKIFMNCTFVRGWEFSIKGPFLGFALNFFQ